MVAALSGSSTGAGVSSIASSVITAAMAAKTVLLAVNEGMSEFMTHPRWLEGSRWICSPWIS